MGDQHHHHTHNHGTDSGTRIGIAFLLNLGFTIVELVGGYLTNSVAILADAVHDLGDSASLGLAWVLDRYAKRQGNERYTFGYRRLSVLSALVTSLILLIGSLFILAESVPRLLNPEPADATGMLGLAILGILVNGAAVLRLRGGASLNERVVSLHLLEDVLGWVAVLVVAIAMHFVNLPILDPILSILITLYILRGTFANLKQAAEIFLQRVPGGISVKQVEDTLRQQPNVQEVHHTHIWTQDGQHHVLTTHVMVAETLSLSKIQNLRKSLHNITQELGIDHATIEIEAGAGNCADTGATSCC